MDKKDQPMETPYDTYRAFPPLDLQQQNQLWEAAQTVGHRVRQETLQFTSREERLEEMTTAYTLFLTAFTLSEELSAYFTLLTGQDA